MDDDTLRARGLCYFILGATEVWEWGQAGAELQWIKSTALGGEPELGEEGTRQQLLCAQNMRGLMSGRKGWRGQRSEIKVGGATVRTRGDGGLKPE